MAEVEDISQEEADTLSPADPTQLSVKQMKSLLRSKGVAINVVEKAALRDLVRQNATRSDVEKFLVHEARFRDSEAKSQSRSSTPSSSASPRTRQSSGSTNLTPELKAFAVQMKSQADAIRSDPARFRMAAPAPFSSYTDDQVRAYADECVKVSEDPVRLKQAYAQAMAQRNGTPANPSSVAAALSSASSMTDAQLDQVIANVKANPDSLKRQLLSTGAQYGMDEAKVNQIVSVVTQMDSSTLRMFLKAAMWLQRLANKAQSAYKWVDAKSGGNGKIIFGVLALVMLYFFYLYLLGPVWYSITYVPKLILGFVTHNFAAVCALFSNTVLSTWF